MYIDIPNHTRIIILEGIAGSGKTTFKKFLRKQLKDSNLYEFSEGELLLGWKHIHIPHVASQRLDYLHTFLDDIEKRLEKEKDALFIFERFHLSVKVLEWEFENDFNTRYERLIERLRKLPTFTIITELKLAEIKERMLHRERNNQWNHFIEEKLKLRKYENLERLSIDQQVAYFSLAEKQGLPYTKIHVEMEHLPKT